MATNQVGTNLASGSRVSLRYALEQTRGTTPAAVVTPLVGVDFDIVTIPSDFTTWPDGSYSSITTTTGNNFITSGFIAGQTVRLSNFTGATNNGDFVVAFVETDGLELVLEDPGNVLSNQAGDADSQIQIILKKLRATGRNINLEKNILESEEVDADGQVTDVRHGFNRVVGSPGYQLSLNDYDDMIEYFMTGTWVTPLTSPSAPYAIDATLKTITNAGADWIVNGFRPGDIIRVASSEDPANDGDWRVTTVTATVLTVVDTGGTMVTNTDDVTMVITFPGARMDLTPGMCTFMVERAFEDVDQYQVFNGCTVNTMQMTVSPEAIINGTFNLLGMSAAAMAQAPVNGTGVTAIEASGSTPFAAFDGAILEGGAIIAVVTSMDFTIERNRSLNPVVGSKFSPDVFEGTARGTGTVSAYFEDQAFFNKFADETESSVWNKFEDPTTPTDFANVVFPRTKYTGANIDPPQEGPIVMEMPFQPLKATGLAAPGGLTVNTMMSIQRSNS
jgi:hypothetical protein